MRATQYRDVSAYVCKGQEAVVCMMCEGQVVKRLSSLLFKISQATWLCLVRATKSKNMSAHIRKGQEVVVCLICEGQVVKRLLPPLFTANQVTQLLQRLVMG